MLITNINIYIFFYINIYIIFKCFKTQFKTCLVLNIVNEMFSKCGVSVYFWPQCSTSQVLCLFGRTLMVKKWKFPTPRMDRIWEQLSKSVRMSWRESRSSLTSSATTVRLSSTSASAKPRFSPNLTALRSCSRSLFVIVSEDQRDPRPKKTVRLVSYLKH